MLSAMIVFELIPLYRSDNKRLAAVYTAVLCLATILFFYADVFPDMPSMYDIVGKVVKIG